LFFYALSVSAGAMAGAALPFIRPPSRNMGTIILGFAAGVMLGAAFFHMLPAAVELAGYVAFPFLVLGFLTIFLLERYVLVHTCEEPEEGCEVHEHVGLPTFLALSAHTLIDGLALGVSVGPGLGATVFAALVLHKIPSSVSLSSILIHEKYTRAKALLMSGVFALMVPAGALLYVLLRDAMNLQNLTPRALAFSAGTFLHLSLADLLPQVHRRAGMRLWASVALVLGVALMWLLKLAGAD
jgi:zinc and cadmium transporter